MSKNMLRKNAGAPINTTSDDSRFLGSRNSQLAAGAAVGGLAGLAGIAGMSPYLRAQAKFMLASKKAKTALDKGSAVPDSVIKEVDDVIAYLRAQGIDPATARVGVTGAGGTGKSTFSKEFARRTGTEHRLLDDIAPTVRDGIRFRRDFSKIPIESGKIYEQSHLLTEVDPKNFDVLVHLETPHSRVKDQLLKRKRGAYQEELWDYGKFQKVLREAFDSAGGASQDFSGGRVRVRTANGTGGTEFNDSTQYIANAQNRFGRPDKIKTRQDAILSNATDSAKRHRGLQSYVKSSTPIKAIGGAATGAGLGAGGVYAAQTYGDKKASFRHDSGVTKTAKQENSDDDEKNRVLLRTGIGAASGGLLGAAGATGAVALTLESRRRNAASAWRSGSKGMTERVAALLNRRLLNDPSILNKLRRTATSSALSYVVPVGIVIGAAAPNLTIRNDASRVLQKQQKQLKEG